MSEKEKKKKRKRNVSCEERICKEQTIIATELNAKQFNINASFFFLFLFLFPLEHPLSLCKYFLRYFSFFSPSPLLSTIFSIYKHFLFLVRETHSWLCPPRRCVPSSTRTLNSKQNGNGTLVVSREERTKRRSPGIQF